MSQYKILEAFALPDEPEREVGSLVELTDEQAAEFAGKVEKVEAPQPPAEPQPTPPATPAEPAKPAPAAAKPWAGNHTVGQTAPLRKKAPGA